MLESVGVSDTGPFFAEKLSIVSIAICNLKPALIVAGKDATRDIFPLGSMMQYGLLASGHVRNPCLYFSLDIGMLHL